MKHLGSIGTFAALAALLIVFSGSAIAGDAFAAGSALLPSGACHFQFFASSNNGQVTEQCDFATGRELFVGPVMCFAAEGNIATFVWQMQIATDPDKQGLYQQVFVVEEGAPGHDVPDRFYNYSESGYNPCSGSGISVYDPGAQDVLEGNFVVKEGKEDKSEK